MEEEAAAKERRGGKGGGKRKGRECGRGGEDQIMKLKKAEEEGRRRQGTGPERKQAWYCLGTHPMYSRAPVVLLDLGEGGGAGDVWTLAQASPKVDECT